jgi:phospholipid/cholesterol/gamma-HCH transport system substrate-binding protein
MKIRKEFIVGIFATAGIVSLVLGFFFLKGQNLLSKSKNYYAIYDKADGLTSGSMVYFNGVQVGKVTDVSVNPKNINTILIAFDVSDTLVKIPLGSTAHMSADLLGSASIVLLLKQDTTGVPLKYHQPGDTLSSTIQEDLKQELTKRFDPLMVKVQELVSTADSAITTIRKIFSNNTGNLNESFDNLNKSVKKFDHIAENLDSITSTLSANRHQVTDILNNVNSITLNLKESNENITALIANTKDVTGNLAKIDFASTINSANSALNTANLILDEIKNGNGTITKLIHDPTLFNNINQMITEATLLVENIKDHPNRYIQFSVFGSKDKGPNLDSKDEKRLKVWVKDSLRIYYP